MRVGEVPVGPGPGGFRQAVDVEFPRGKQDLNRLAVDRVRIDIDVRELVVRDEGLELLVDRGDDPIVPDPDVAERRLVGG
ncbi:MAG: hypothetical protein H0T72_10305 [Chloroflexia bacterium]|nr:hypothetical protein [Chloroflexia bacterium]